MNPPDLAKFPAEPAPSPAPDAVAPPPAAAGTQLKSAGRKLVEDLLVTACGMATSAAVAYGSFAASRHWDTAIYTWMANFVIPVGAIICGFVAALGYWIGSRVFHHRPSRLLLGNIVLVSISTFFWIYQLDYSEARYHGAPLSEVMSFPDFLRASIENMTYKSQHDAGDGMALGKWGWGVAALQVLGFCLGGFMVYGLLTAVPYCDRCSRYFKKLWSRASRWGNMEDMAHAYETVDGLIAAGHLQAAIDQHAGLGEARRFGVAGLLTMSLQKCPTCENRRLRLLAQKRNGNNYTKLAERTVPTAEPIHPPVKA